MSKRKIVLLSVLGAAIVAALVAVLRPAPVSVEVAVVERGAFVETVEDEGITRLRDTYTVRAPVSGFLRRVEPEAGDEVQRGAALFEIESPPAPVLDARGRQRAEESVSAARARLDEAEARREALAARRDEAEAAYNRRRGLPEQGLLAMETLDQARSRFEAARAEARAARHAVEAARFELARARAELEVADGQRDADEALGLAVSAPITGIVTARHRESEGPVNAGEPVLDIGDMDSLEVRVDLLSMDAVRVRPGMRVLIERWGGDEPLTGSVRRIRPSGFTRVSALGVDEQRVPVLVRLEESARAAREQLGAGYRVEGRFILREEAEALRVPASALVRDGEEWALFVVEDERARLRRVTIGARSGMAARVRSGVEAGERVITHPGDRIADGVRVRTR